MTPKEKAKKLLKQMYPMVSGGTTLSRSLRNRMAAKFCVEQVMIALHKVGNEATAKELAFWQQVNNYLK